MRPLVSPEEFRDWQGHPVTEWVFAMCRKAAAMQQGRWALAAWHDGVLDPVSFNEARVRADCYMALPESSYDDWIAIDDSED